MSDINGLIRGSDGKLSLRRITGAIAIIGGVVLSFVATYQPGDWTRFIGCFACFGAGFLLMDFAARLDGLRRMEQSSRRVEIMDTDHTLPAGSGGHSRANTGRLGQTMEKPT